MSLPSILMPALSPPPSAGRATRSSSRRVQRAALTPFYDDPQWKLFLTTSRRISAWDGDGCETVFTSSSRGIVAAKRALDGSTVAIADAQVVMLHQIKDGQDKSYRLKGTQRCRLLQYSRDSRSLFYTDALHNSVLSYSLSEKRVSDAARSHPSPVTAFAISCDSNLVLSSSEQPPVIQIHNQLLATTISLAPTASAAGVVSCAFHPSRKQIFVLAFKDGVLAAYDYNSLSKGKQEPVAGMARCHPKAIHAFRHLHDRSISGSPGITGVEFIPGQRSRAITVGEDGRCFLVDFEQRSTVSSWHIGAPGTSLSIRQITTGPVDRKNELGGFMVAIGTVHGRCVVYDGNANKITEMVVDKDGDTVLDVEWVYGDVNLPEVEVLSPTKSRSASPRSARKSRSGSLYQHGANPHISILEPLEETNTNTLSIGPFSSPIDDSLQEIVDAADESYMKLFSPVKRKRPTKPTSLQEKSKQKSPDTRTKVDHRSVISAPQLWEDKKSENVSEPEKEPVKRDVFTAFQSEQTTGEETTNSDEISVLPPISSVLTDSVRMEDTTSDGKPLSEIRSIKASVDSRRSKSTLSIIAPYLPSRIRTVPGSRIGTKDASATARKTASEPAAGPPTSASSSSAAVSEVKTKTTQPAPTTGPDSTDFPMSHTKDAAGDDEAEDFDDIWLAETTTMSITLPSAPSTSTSRKRRRVAADDDDVDGSSILGSTSLISRPRSAASKRSSPLLLRRPAPASTTMATSGSEVPHDPLQKMMRELSAQIAGMQEVMNDRFEEQNRRLVEMQDEVRKVRVENEELKRLLGRDS